MGQGVVGWLDGRMGVGAAVGSCIDSRAGHAGGDHPPAPLGWWRREGRGAGGEQRRMVGAKHTPTCLSYLPTYPAGLTQNITLQIG